MAADWTETNLGSMAKQLGGLITQYDIYPMVYVGATGYDTAKTQTRSGVELTGYSTNTNSSGSDRTIDKITTSVFDVAYIPIISEEGLSEPWVNGDTAIPKFILTFKR